MNGFRGRYLLQGGVLVEDGLLCVQGECIVDADPKSVEDLGNVLIVPGLVNAHSHAFQRTIRGATEYVLADRLEDDFWTWRERMYGAALTMSPSDIYAASLLAFSEMARSGITAVGEFHYIHHATNGSRYSDPNELAHQVIRAAKDVGLRIVLLLVAYNRAGVGRPATDAQRRFVESDVDAYLKRVEALLATYSADPMVTIGVAPHSIRAVPGPWLQAIAAFATQENIPFHIHACEQRREIEESLQEYGRPPVEVFRDLGVFDANTTLVHATHLTANELQIIEQSQPSVCACPTTERNLGDGFLPASDLWESQVPVCLGSDSHTQIDLWAEMRLLEYHERLRLERRNVLPTIEVKRLGGRRDTWQSLMPSATTHGAHALGLAAGNLGLAEYADFAVIDLDHVTLQGASIETLMNDVTLTMPPGAVRAVYVGGVHLQQPKRVA